MRWPVVNASARVYVLRWRLRGAVSWHLPSLARLYFRFTRRIASAPGAETELVIDGYPRSGNSFAYRLARQVFAEGQLVHHVHAPACIRAGVRGGCTTVLLIRPPREATVSLVALGLRELEKLGAGWSDKEVRYVTAALLSYWTWYHSRCLPYLGQVYVIELETLRSAPEQVLKWIAPVSAEAARRAVRQAYAEGERREHVLPQAARRRHADRVNAILDADDLDDAVARASRLYERFAAVAAQPT